MYPFEFDTLDAATLAVIEGALPKSLAVFVPVIGLKSTLALVDGLGGAQFTFPKKQHGPGAGIFSVIEGVVGLDVALLLAKNFGGEKFAMPNCKHLDRMFRNRELIREYEAALKVTSATQALNELSIRYRMSYRQLADIVNGKAGTVEVLKRPCVKVRTPVAQSHGVHRI